VLNGAVLEADPSRLLVWAVERRIDNGGGETRLVVSVAHPAKPDIGIRWGAWGKKSKFVFLFNANRKCRIRSGAEAKKQISFF
jgi:hypothetical protein